MRSHTITRALVATVLSFSIVSPAFAQLTGSVDTGGTTTPTPVVAPSAPAPTPEPAPVVVTPPSAPVEVITTPIPSTPVSSTPTVSTDSTTASVSTESTTSTVTPVVTQTVAPIITPPADTTAPVIADVSSISLEPHNATIIWTTDELATASLQYGTTQSYGSTVTLAVSASLAHDATMLNLTPNTTYYYCIHATDLAGNTSSSCSHSVTTAASEMVIDTLPPVITLETVSAITTSSASVTWATDKLAEGYVEYGTTNAYGSQTSLQTDFALSHTVAVSGLSENTTYHYRIHSRDASGNTLVTPDNTFITSSAAGVVPEPTTTTVTVPETTIAVSTPSTTAGNTTVTTPNLFISSVAADTISEHGATITWTTDVPSTSNVVYGDKSEFDETAGSATLTTNHSVTLANLDSDTTYQFRVESAPLGLGAVATVSGVHDFTTLAMPIVIDPPANLLTVSSSGVSANGASVSFTTDEAVHGAVEYGLTTSYGESAMDTSMQTTHTIALSALLPGTTYHFRVKALDETDNITYSIDHEFTTTGIAVSVSNPSTSEASLTSEVATGEGPSSSGIAAPAIVTVAPVDGEVVFVINPQISTGDSTVIVVRGDGTFPASPTDGDVVYDGRAPIFTDTNLTNGSTYDYSIYTRRSGGGYSSPVRISARPVAGVEQVQLDRNPILEQGTAIEHFTADISIGTKSDEVIHLQQVLNTESVHPSQLTTGYFGSLTLASVKRFQAKYNLPQTGVVDAATRLKLNALSQGWMLLGAPTGLTDLTTDIKPGDTGQDVADLQEFLTYEGSYEEGYITGTYGPLTKESVADFQKKFGVTPVSGYVGPKTRHTILTVLGQ